LKKRLSFEGQAEESEGKRQQQKNIKMISGFHKDKKDREKVRIGKIF
jgi:hypothetical protein